ncbi:MAG: hypothetical protein C5B50_14930 [Verrucomicrobia bacterium]|nr:MAG: hypothetical protein C5B50_14930 [Verrucomicrobiota bacterium]
MGRNSKPTCLPRFVLSWPFRSLLGIAWTIAPRAFGADPGQTPPGPAEPAITNATAANAHPPAESFKQEATRLLLQEATRVAVELHLPESLPIVETNLLEAFVAPPHIVLLDGGIGTVTTINYTYCVSKAWKFCYLERYRQQEDRRRWYADSLRPLRELDKRAAYQMATQWLGAVSVNVAALNRDCRLRIEAFMPVADRKRGKFLPLYWVYWTKGGMGHGSVAFVELFAPTRTIVQLRVEDPAYNNRQPLHLASLDAITERRQKTGDN